MVYTYLIGDNFVFRLAEHILVGVSVGWATIQVVFNLIIPAIERVRDARGVSDYIAYLVPIILGAVFLFRPLRAARPATNLVMAVVIGTVSALALAGAVAGTLLPQIGATMLPLNQGSVTDIIGGVFLVAGTLLSLWYFQFTVRKSAQTQTGAAATGAISRNARLLGRWSIMLAFGAVFASVFLTYFAALLDRILFLLKIQF
jgi:hypothetical protein